MNDRESPIEALTKRLADQGLLIESGWQALRLQVIPLNASDVQVTEMRKAFFAGAQHLFASIVGMVDEDLDPTPDDLRRVELVHKELEGFVAELTREARGSS